VEVILALYEVAARYAPDETAAAHEEVSLLKGEFLRAYDIGEVPSTIEELSKRHMSDKSSKNTIITSSFEWIRFHSELAIFITPFSVSKEELFCSCYYES